MLHGVWELLIIVSRHRNGNGVQLIQMFRPPCCLLAVKNKQLFQRNSIKLNAFIPRCIILHVNGNNKFDIYNIIYMPAIRMQGQKINIKKAFIIK